MKLTKYRPPLSIRLLIIVVFAVIAAPTQWVVAQSLRMVSYNVLDGPVSAAEDEDFRVVIQAIGNFEILGNAQAIDLLAFQEGPEDLGQYNEIEANFETVFGGNYESSISAPDFFGCRTGFIYSMDRIQLISAVTLSSGLTHNIRRTRFRPIGGPVEDEFYIYSIHLKAGTTNADVDERTVEAGIIRSDAANLPTTANIMYAGDLNLQGSEEGAWQTLIAGSDNASALDSLNTPFGFRDNISWNDNLAFQPFHTQNPVNNMDDRFDAILFNERLADGTGLEYVTGSASVLGNNGSHTLGQGINTGNGTSGFGPELVAFSDHAPVICDFRFNQTAPETVSTIESSATLSRTVRPTGPVTGPTGDGFLNIEGSSNGSFASFGVVDFDFNGQPNSAVAARKIVLEILQSNAAFSADGPVSIFVASPAATQIPIDNSIHYQTGQNGLPCVPPILSIGAERAATYAAVHRTNSGTTLPNGTLDRMVLFGDAIEQALVDAINGDGLVRLLITPDEAATAATYAGFTSNLGAPSCTFDLAANDGGVDSFPTQFSIVNGSQGPGSPGSLIASDDDRVRFFGAVPDKQDGPFIQVIFNGSLETNAPQSLSITLESRVNSPNLVTSIEFFNFVSGAWEVIDSSSAQLSDQTLEITPTGDPTRFVAPSNLILTRVSWSAAGPILLFPIAADIDLLKWTTQ